MGRDNGGNIGSAVQSHARTRGPYDGKLFVYLPFQEGVSGFVTTDEGGVYTPSAEGAWRLLRLVEDFVYSPNEGERQVRTDRWNGKAVPIEGFYPDINPTVSFKLGEQFDPYVLQLGFSKRQAPTKQAADTLAEEWAFTLHGTKLLPLPIEFNLLDEIDNGVTGVAGVGAASGGALPAGTYFYSVTPVYGTAEASYDADAESAGVEVTGSTSIITVSWTPPSGVQPDCYRVYRNPTGVGDYTDPCLVAEVPGYLTSAVDVGDALQEGIPNLTPVALVVTDITGETTYASGDDYILDAANGKIRRVAGGAIGDGEMVRCSYSVALEAGVVNILDQGRYKSLHMPLMFIGQQTGTRGKTGMVRFIFDKVDWNKGADGITPQQAFDDAGIEFTLPVDFDETNGRFGEQGVYDEAIQDFTIITLN